MASDDDEPSDRRRAERIPINTEFAAMPSATYISDLSEYGVFVHTPTPSSLGTKIKLRFTVLLDDPVIVEGEGRVVRHQLQPIAGMGIEFTGLAPEMILRINDVLSRQQPRDSGPPLPREETLDSLESARIEIGPASASGAAFGAFRPPSMPGQGSDENAKTGIYQALGDADDDGDDLDLE